jgi:hypothetical protein
MQALVHEVQVVSREDIHSGPRLAGALDNPVPAVPPQGSKAYDERDKPLDTTSR